MPCAITHWQVPILSIVRLEGLLLLYPAAIAIAYVLITIITAVLLLPTAIAIDYVMVTMITAVSNLI